RTRPAVAHLARQQVLEIKSLDMGFGATAILATTQAIQALPLKVLYAGNRKAKIGKVLQEQIRTAKADEGSQARCTHCRRTTNSTATS
mgnify:CR=1